MTRRIIFAILILLVACCIAVSLLVAAGALVLWSQNEPITPLLPTSVAPTARPTPVVRGTALPTLPPIGNLPAATALQMDEIQKQVTGLRGLTLLKPIRRGVLTTEELRQRVTSDFFEDYNSQEAADDVRVLSAFGLINPDFNLYQFYTELLVEQVSGFYDSKTKEMFVVQGSGFKGNERLTYAHEFTHVLQDQTYDLREGLKMQDSYCEKNSEQCAAVQALVEGDASLTEQNWLFKYSTNQDKKQIQEFVQSLKMPVYDSAPPFLKEDFIFPYQEGLSFAQALYDRSGYDAIDKAFTNPPVSTAQILHPEKYPDIRPVTVNLPDLAPTLGTSWRELDRGVMGEWYSYLILAFGRDKQFRLKEQTASQAVKGWSGDAYTVYGKDNGSENVVVFDQRWQNGAASDLYWEALKEYGNDRWGKPIRSQANRLEWEATRDGYVTIIRRDQQTLWLNTPDVNMARQILTNLPEFQGQ